MRFLFFLCLFCFSCQVQAEKRYDAGIEALLTRLDSLIENNDEYIAEKENRIQQLRYKKKHIHTEEEAFWLNKMFYEEYYVYNADSAMIYANENLAISQRQGNQERIADWTLKKAFLLSATGLLTESMKLLQDISTASLPLDLRVEYYGQMMYLYSHFGQYSGDDNLNLRAGYYQKEGAYKDSVYAVITPQDPFYLWYKGWKFLGTSQQDEVKQELKTVVEGSALNSRHDAMNAYILACLCREVNLPSEYLKYMIYSSIADVRIANKDIASLEELSKVLFELGDIDRAYTYINYCLQNAQMYRNRVRVIGISQVQNAIHKAYQERNRKQEARLRLFLVTVSILSLVLIIAIFYIYRQVKRLALSRAQLNEANILLNEHIEELSLAQTRLAEVNEELQSVNEQLTETNGQLCESNYVKEEYIGYVFTICSNYISKLDDFRKTINRKAKTGQFDDIISLTSTASVAQKELKEFYHNFDAIFLHVYPDFVTDFNALLHPDERIVIKEGDLLNTDLRIYALVRLGINDSVKIAEFLHCSPQTVYNIRLKTRNKAVIPKEDFAKVVSSLGKMQD